jgi:hypothetical protein
VAQDIIGPKKKKNSEKTHVQKGMVI